MRTALSAFDAEAIDYLVKPVRPERLAAALERVRTFVAGRGRQAWQQAPMPAPARTCAHGSAGPCD